MYFKFVGYALEISLRFSVFNSRLINVISNLIYDYVYDVGLTQVKCGTHFTCVIPHVSFLTAIKSKDKENLRTAAILFIYLCNNNNFTEL